MSGRPGSLDKTLGHDFSRPELLQQALTHSSAVRDRAVSNQRLEFLGDRVLGLTIARLLFERFPDEEEGKLSRRHTALVRREALARVALQVGIDAHIVMSPSEEKGGGGTNPNLLADTCEAVICALYLDGGLEAAEKFILRHWTPLMDEDPRPPKDPKTELQEWAQARNLSLPSYRLTERQGTDHAPIFIVQVHIDGLDPAQGSGSSKRAAEQEAAGAMVARIAGDKAKAKS